MSETIQETIDSGMVAILQKAEIDTQIQTAKRFPRSIRRFVEEATGMVTLSEKIAGECFYALPRDGKTIEGPSARFAEVIVSAWGNSRSGARVIDDSGDFIVAQGVMHDLERNVAITYEVRRRITDRNGKRFKPDMIGVTANAACSIALRNAILKGIPKAFWSDMYDAARKTAIGDIKTLSSKRVEALAHFQKMGVDEKTVCFTLGVQGKEDIGLEELTTLRGLATAIKDGDTTIDQAFQVPKRGKDAVQAKDVDLEPKKQEDKPMQEEETEKISCPNRNGDVMFKSYCDTKCNTREGCPAFDSK